MHDIAKSVMRWTPPNTDWFFPTAFSDWDEQEYNAVQRVISSGRFTMGPEVETFESEFAAYHRMKYGIMVNSGSSANLIIIAALIASRKIKRGDEVLVPALAWSTTYAPLVQHGLRLRLMDVDNTWCSGLPDVTGSELVVGCSILGNPAPLNFLKIAIESHGGVFIEDNCESLGAMYGNELCGTFGLMNSFSFFHSHQISAIEGGMILTNDVECAKLCRIFRAHGWTRDVELPTSFDSSYNFTHFGYNVRPLEMHAAIASVQLRKLKGFIEARCKNAVLFRDLTSELPIVHPVIRTLDPSPFGLPFTVASPEIRLKLVEKLAEKGIDSRLPTGGSFTKHVYGKPWASQPTPFADKIHDTGMFLGNGPFPLDEQIGVAVEVIKKVLV